MTALGRALTALLFGLAMLCMGCLDVITAPTNLTYSSNPATYQKDTAIVANTPTHSGGVVETYSVSPALPAGLTLDTKSGVITGTPTVGAATASYTVKATNTAGNTTVSLSITVNAPVITITTQPTSKSILVGQTASFSVVATGTGTLGYEWRKDDVPVVGGNTTTYTTPSAVIGDNGAQYTVVISDAFNNKETSTPATLTVLAAGGPGTSLATGSMTAARAFHSATLLPSGKALVAGGFSGTALATADLYDPTAGTFAATGSLTTAREYHSATLLDSGKVLIVGGQTLGSAPTATAELYDPATGLFTATGSLAAARWDHTATLLPNGKVLIVGGRNATLVLASAEIYDPATGLFTATTHAPVVSRTTHTATLLENGKVLLAGGQGVGSPTPVLFSAELYDPSTDTFIVTGSMSLPRYYATATRLSTGKVLLVGGAASAAAELYDPALGTFAATTGNLTTVRAFGHTATLLPTGEVLIAGGKGSGSPAPLLSAGELYDPATGLFTPTGSLTAVREVHTATALTTGKVLLVGGFGLGYLATAELYY
ncbi:MAG: kelch repeat-containing protein [Holophaga sp.]